MRPSRHETMLEIVEALGKRTTCIRRGVGAVLVNNQGQILSTGYNGVAKGEKHCNKSEQSREYNFILDEYIDVYPHACPGSTAQSGSLLHECKAIHAEQNALLQCPDVQKIHVCYTSCSPCIHCIKLLMNTSCSLLVFQEVYDNEALNLWYKDGERDFLFFPKGEHV